MALKRILAVMAVLLLTVVTLCSAAEPDTLSRQNSSRNTFKALVPVAEGGSAVAQLEIGVMYRKGQGVKRDYASAALWFRRAAEQGLVEAQNNLGGLYVTGKGVRRDYVQAHMWFDLAATEGLKQAQENRERIGREMTPVQLEKARKLARNWRQQHARKEKHP